MNNTYAFIKDNKVVNTVIIEDINEDIKNIFITDFNLDDIVSSDDSVYIGSSYINNEFIPKSPFESWIWNSTDKVWQAPVNRPESMLPLYWNEELLNWEQETI
jgi:hypothetical protein